MNAPLDDTALVLADLIDSKQALDDVRGSPRDVRRAFARFVDLSQRLTSVMRRDYSRSVNGKWEASEFTGWTVDTEFLKWLRNQDQHSSQIYISVHQRNFYRVDSLGDQLLVLEGTWVLIDQLATEVPNGMELRLPNPMTGAMSELVVEPVRTEYQYLFQPRTPEEQGWFQKVGRADIHLLADRTLPVFIAYHDHFRAKGGGQSAGLT